MRNEKVNNPFENLKGKIAEFGADASKAFKLTVGALVIVAASIGADANARDMSSMFDELDIEIAEQSQQVIDMSSPEFKEYVRQHYAAIEAEKNEFQNFKNDNTPDSNNMKSKETLSNGMEMDTCQETNSKYSRDVLVLIDSHNCM